MNYLFIDIECCDGVHLCSLGGVLTDCNFHMLDKFDLLVNPQLRFKLSGRKDDGIKLFYPEQKFYEQPNFRTFYNNIKQLLMLPDVTLVGFSIQNDFNFINLACERYGLPQLSLTGYDIQLIYKKMTNDTTVRALEKIADALDIPHGAFSMHRSCDDAHLSMYILRNLCYMEHKSIESVFEKYEPYCKVQSKFYDETGHQVRPRRRPATSNV